MKIYEVETPNDLYGGKLFTTLASAKECLKVVLGRQCDPEYFECDDFQKVELVQLNRFNEDGSVDVLEAYDRISDKRFQKRA